MSKNTSISLGNYFDQFVHSQVSEGRYKNVSEVVRAGLRLLENEESKTIALRNAIQEGLESGIAHDFDLIKNLEELKASRKRMVNYQLTNKAVQDLNRIWNYTYETWSEDRADDYYQMLLSRCNDVANKPDLGKQYPQVKEGLLGIKANKHLIFYRVLKADSIEIIRILHGRMDLNSRLGE